MKKRIFKTITICTLALVMLFSLAACGPKNVGAGTYAYEKNVLNAEEVESPEYIFGSGLLTEYGTRAHRVELTLNKDGTYSMSVHGWMQEDTEGGDIAVGEAFEFGNGMYAEWFSTSQGTYTSDETTVTIHAESATFKIPDLGVSYMSQLFAGGNAAAGSYAPEGENYFGEWSSADVPEILNLFPDTVFTIDGNTIVTWTKA